MLTTMKTTKRNGKIEGIYFNWLYDQIKERGTSELENFIFELHCISFICLIPNDDNRVEDGIALRSKFEDELDYDIPEVPLAGLPCTVLEMLIALADKLDFILFDHKKGSQFKLWFWLLIDNLKLQKYTNDEDATQKKNFNSVVVNKFVNREYQANGKGGLFPLDHPLVDQRDVEIWYQLMNYISENYDI